MKNSNGTIGDRTRELPDGAQCLNQMRRHVSHNGLHLAQHCSDHPEIRITEGPPYYVDETVSKAVPRLECLFRAPHHGGTVSIPGQFMWDLRWTKWHWDNA